MSNEVIVSGLSARTVWRHLVDTSTWESYYDGVSDISFPDSDGPQLRDGTRFSFSSLGFPPIDARIVELKAPTPDVPGRLSWTGLLEGGPAERAEALHAWLVEDLPGGRVRILTQESQIGKPAAALAAMRPDPVLNGHQAWLDGLVEAARR
ncbi:SRPBCC domain-containing protein [Catenuloplanes sp. NPDC051500]|uniref:SRPBCC domain-containing protein n=1 Tax=Catenuloplanes sp. NPDC051500 TaxID=3363959 RepID=UPI0037A2C548